MLWNHFAFCLLPWHWLVSASRQRSPALRSVLVHCPLVAGSVLRAGLRLFCRASFFARALISPLRSSIQLAPERPYSPAEGVLLDDSGARRDPRNPASTRLQPIMSHYGQYVVMRKSLARRATDGPRACMLPRTTHARPLYPPRCSAAFPQIRRPGQSLHRRGPGRLSFLYRRRETDFLRGTLWCRGWLTCKRAMGVTGCSSTHMMRARVGRRRSVCAGARCSGPGPLAGRA
ncbi:hypothetical protein EJ06DRAFT_306054 [Trichodelitschia bisporula]|uniref:Secreted protein n=1 Tax=Trichodelitschia bisporula TaxID=703511 RepID=A0A6G1I3N3_9PEZI|nr:hypothetical protein EJ06DRAFT_306054 [Trichodelitschia bisporula]